MIEPPARDALSMIMAWPFAAVGGIVIAVLGLVVLPFMLPVGGPEAVHPSALADPNGVFVQIAGESLYYTHNPGDGDAVVLLHGFGGSTVTWTDTAQTLAAVGFDVYAVDLLGFGLSEKGWRHDYSHAAQAERVIRVMDALGIERASIVGHSMGGNVAAHLALRHRERVDKLVLVSAAILSGDEGAGGPLGVLPAEALEVPFVRRWAQVALRRLVTPMFDQLLFGAVYQDGTINAALVDGYRRALMTPEWDLALLGMTRDARDNDVSASISDLDVATLLMWGAEDTWVPAQDAETLNALIPGAQRVEFDAVGHLPMHETPPEFNTSLLAFLRGE